MPCATSVPALCGLVSFEVPCVLGEKSDSSISISKSIAPIVSSLVTPAVIVNGSFVDALVNLISHEALIYHVGDNMGEDVRLQIDWLHCSSDFSSESSGDELKNLGMVLPCSMTYM
ncbi:hypothetical protein MA16_Dca001208 [Dendrobium catenatum]|uniref:Uncharacterized protein n=1 Tax=Dendrobium catenatum TaxID=906689 RepID=A0A2I0WLR6_9ASPA|nr:hypothetical protein MA16_Dca001208 [Dendrobium catenatum]